MNSFVKKSAFSNYWCGRDENVYFLLSLHVFKDSYFQILLNLIISLNNIVVYNCSKTGSTVAVVAC